MAGHPSRDDLVAFALGALEPKEARHVEAHAPGCPTCTREIEALTPAVAALAESVEQLEAPASLRERVMAEVHSDVAADREPARSQRERRGLSGFLLRPAAALAVVALIAAGVTGYLIAGDDGGEQTTTVAVMPDGAPKVGGTLEVGDVSSRLKLEGMAQLTGSQVYQVWVAQGGSVKPSSNFIPERDGTATTGVDGHLDPGTKVMVTREPRAGRTTPTLPILLSATVQ